MPPQIHDTADDFGVLNPTAVFLARQAQEVPHVLPGCACVPSLDEVVDVGGLHLAGEAKFHERRCSDFHGFYNFNLQTSRAVDHRASFEAAPVV